MRFIPIAGFLLLVVLLGYLLLNKPESNSGLENKPLPALELTALNSKTTWDMKKLNGHVTVLNFFASWCVPCASEMPELVALKKQFPNLRFAGAAWNDEAPSIQKWLKKNGNPFDTLWLDQNGDATMALGIQGIPETFVIDAKGTIRYRQLGPITKDIRANTLDPLLQQLIEEAKHAH